MSLDTVHPELPAEQAYVDRAYACMAAMLEEVLSFGAHGRNDFELEAFERWKQARVAALSDTRSALVFGRIDQAAGDTFYIGRHHVRERDYETVVVDWRAPVAQAFYRANAADRMGLRRRRHFLVEGREVLGIADDQLDHVEAIRGDDILQDELRKQRGAHMRDIVATIQAEQDVIIRAPLEGIVVVQGGPGTGKTAIGLHRAAFLLYEHRRTLMRQGVLVVGPNPVFMEYVSQVLPSLGESAMTQVAVDGLVHEASASAPEGPDVARRKGDARMASVIADAVEARWGRLDADVGFRVHATPFVLRVADAEREVQTLRSRGVPFRRGRELLRENLLQVAWRSYVDALLPDSIASSYEDVIAAVRRDPAFRSALDRVWPALSAANLVRDLYANPPAGWEAVRRPRRAPWTSADMPLVDEAAALIDGPPDRHGHVVVDEAQDLSPMQLRMLSRRSIDGSMTVLGDLGQATGAWAHDHWDEVLQHLPGEARLSELTLGYRVGAAIMDVAARVLAEAAPKLRAPAAVRREAGLVSFVAGDAAAAARAGWEMVARLGAGAVIAPASELERVRGALVADGRAFGDADTQGLAQPLTLVPAARAKGLEFDGVVLFEPSAIVDEAGLRMLYVCVTRAMRELVIVRSRPLPRCLEG
jgi:hypothetical protein